MIKQNFKIIPIKTWDERLSEVKKRHAEEMEEFEGDHTEEYESEYVPTRDAE